MTRRTTGEQPPERCEDHADSATAPLPAPELTEAECRRCGTYIAGLDGRYACGVCGWVNDHSEGHRRLPRADEDPDRPAKGRRRPPQLPGPPAEPAPGPVDPGPRGPFAQAAAGG
ncbi:MULTISPECIES: hypothetical protein [unclassified Streptomyces]|uniref:hypothetical protein n=1 Tax=Streptomyces TaxID=1883 RepID=UPI000DC7AC60|nr:MULTISPECIES: hypothetical protein [unclassified Streptomyces]AWZ05044.1 hypothetical protein DRB89_10695 [Streptomyces sp. ICC4]AWZ11231.1 hypothetical protein DRB96_01535 [Streptomyces sp. ICC1]